MNEMQFHKMKAQIEINNIIYYFDASSPIDISIPVKRKNSPNAFGLPEPEYSAVRSGSFIGSVAEGGSCNCETIHFCPHGNGTHTEGIGHITKEQIFINQL